MLIRIDTLQPWKGERLEHDILYQKNIDVLWTDAELEAIGLVQEVPATLVDGSRWVGTSTWDAQGIETRDSELIPPPTPTEVAERDAGDLDEIFSQRVLLKILYHIAKDSRPQLQTKQQFREWIEGLE